jgi:hypothetical protein
MGIRMVPDLGAPVTVTAVDLITEATAPDYNEWASYVLAAGGYVSAFMGWGGDFAKNVGIASFPWAAKKIYERVRGGAASRSQRVGFRAPVSRSASPIRQTPGPGFAGLETY